ncbi:MAG: succinate dehydrogenase, cytochrome b556 subunit [Casimicrobium sp.]
MRVSSTDMRRNDWRARGNVGYVAFIVHRVSGVALALFLPLHFWALGTSLQGAAALESFLRWTDMPLFKFAEWGLVVLLAAHAGGGVRLLLIEFGRWQGTRKRWIGAALAASVLVGVLLGAIMIS